jgi:hypothetical protein
MLSERSGSATGRGWGFTVAGWQSRAGQASSPKNYAVGLEMSCPGGAYDWAPEIPSGARLAGAMPRKCELVHNRAKSSRIRVLAWFSPLWPNLIFAVACFARRPAMAPFVIRRDLCDAGRDGI